MATITDIVERIVTRNPSTGSMLADFAVAQPSVVDARLSAAVRVGAAWSKTSVTERSVLLRKLAAYLRDEKGRLASLATAEMGKPIVEAEAEVEKCAWCCEHYADN